jgi:hypothetical protein
MFILYLLQDCPLKARSVKRASRLHGRVPVSLDGQEMDLYL